MGGFQPPSSILPILQILPTKIPVMDSIRPSMVRIREIRAFRSLAVQNLLFVIPDRNRTVTSWLHLCPSVSIRGSTRSGC